MDMPSRASISHVVSPVARVVPDLRDGAGLGSPVREVYFVRLTGVTDTTRHWSDKRHSLGSVRRTAAAAEGHRPTVLHISGAVGICSHG